ncbi:transmembrane 7 superfamily member 3 isoform X2 [Amia ocellicauda]|uniref:transmembrane 7 superfamily member 3 isoform X2 n=1 Tax=Amia ocellicauda TaxID=2972642 RepID=UPI003463A844
MQVKEKLAEGPGKMFPPLCWLFLMRSLIALQGAAAQEVPSHIEFSFGKFRNVSLPKNVTVEAVVSKIPADITYIVFQFHTQHQNATLSYDRIPTVSSSQTGFDVGLLSPLRLLQRSLQWYLLSPEGSPVAGTAVILPYRQSDPVPGGCNLEFNLSIDASIYLHYNLFETIIRFAPANIGYARGSSPPLCDVNMGQNSRWRLQYDVYQYFLPENNLSEELLITHIQKVANVQEMTANGRRLVTLTSNDKTMVSFSSIPGQGVIYSVIVRDPLLNTSASYVPVHTYGCSFTSMLDNCYTLGKVSTKVLFTMLGIAGLLICFFGHRFFKSELFCVGFAFVAFLFFILITRTSSLDYDCNFQIFRSDAVFWVTFSSIVMLFPLIFLRWPREGNITACAIVGGYAVVLAVNSYIYTSLSYIVLDILKRALNNDFSRAFTDVPFQAIDFIMITVWVVLAVSGMVLQLYRERSRPFFPPSPYVMWKQERERRKTNILDPSYHVPSLWSRLKSRLRDAFQRREPAGERTPLLL